MTTKFTLFSSHKRCWDYYERVISCVYANITYGLFLIIYIRTDYVTIIIEISSKIFLSYSKQYKYLSFEKWKKLIKIFQTYFQVIHIAPIIIYCHFISMYVIVLPFLLLLSLNLKKKHKRKILCNLNIHSFVWHL